MTSPADKLRDAIQDVIADQVGDQMASLFVTGFVVTVSVTNGERPSVLTINSPEQSPATDYGLHKMGHQIAKAIMKSQSVQFMQKDDED